MVKWIRKEIGPREIFGAAGLGMLGWGLWLVHPTAMYLGIGAVLLALAVFGRRLG